MKLHEVLNGSNMEQDLYLLLRYLLLRWPTPELVELFLAKHGIGEQKQVDHYETKIFETNKPDALIKYLTNHGWELIQRDPTEGSTERLRFTKGLQ